MVPALIGYIAAEISKTIFRSTNALGNLVYAAVLPFRNSGLDSEERISAPSANLKEVDQMYDKFASQYDYFVNWKSRLAFEMPFIQEQLSRLSDAPERLKVLDAACGTGQHAIALARLGYDVSGADLFPQMLSLANTNALAADVNITFKAAGFGSIAAVFPKSAFRRFYAWATLCRT